MLSSHVAVLSVPESSLPWFLVAVDMFSCPVLRRCAAQPRDLVSVPPLPKQARLLAAKFTQPSLPPGTAALMSSLALPLSALPRSLTPRSAVPGGLGVSRVRNALTRRSLVPWLRDIVPPPWAGLLHCVRGGLTLIYTSHGLGPTLRLVNGLLRCSATQHPSAPTAYGAALRA